MGSVTVLVNSPLTKREGRKKWTALSEVGATQSENSGTHDATMLVSSWDQLFSLWVAPSSLKAVHFFLPSLFVKGLFPKIRHRPHFSHLMALPILILIYLGWVNVSWHSFILLETMQHLNLSNKGIQVSTSNYVTEHFRKTPLSIIIHFILYCIFLCVDSSPPCSLPLHSIMIRLLLYLQCVILLCFHTIVQ